MSLSQYAQHGIAALGDDSVMPHSSNVYGMGRQYMPRSSNDLINHCARQHPNPSGAWSDRGGGGHEHRQPRPSIQEPFRYPYTTYGHSAHAASLPNLPSHPTQERPSTRRLPRLSDATSQWSPPSQLYTIADPESIGGSSSSVKVEPDDDGFIQDLTHQSSSPPPPFEHLVPPTEVPLRATQASKEMRKLMGVFRLNPFSMHHGGGRGVSAPLWNGEDAGPLEEPPSFIEYQLEGVQIEVDVDFEDGSSELSPGFDADMGCDGATTAASNSWTGSGEGVRSSWQAANWGAPGVFSSPSGTSASLELDYPDSLASQLPGKLPSTLWNRKFYINLIFNLITQRPIHSVTPKTTSRPRPNRSTRRAITTIHRRFLPRPLTPTPTHLPATLRLSLLRAITASTMAPASRPMTLLPLLSNLPLRIGPRRLHLGTLQTTPGAQEEPCTLRTATPLVLPDITQQPPAHTHTQT